MNKLHNDVLAIIGAALGKVPLQLSVPLDWDNIYTLLQRAKLHGVTYRCVANLPEGLLPPPEILASWKRVSFNNGIRQMFIRHQLTKIFDKARTMNLQLVLFKGITLSALYPEPSMRFSCDADIWVSPSDRHLAEKLFTEMGYFKDEVASKDHVPAYRINLNNQSMKIELHDCLWEDYEGKQTQYLDSLKLTDATTFITETFLGVTANTLGYTEHLIFQIFHIAKHFAFEGLPLRYLTDVTLYINAYNKKIDYDLFWNALKLLKYDIFTASLLKICQQYFGLCKDVIPDSYAEIDVNETFLLDLVYAGRIDEHKIENWASTEMITSYFLRKNEAATSKFQRFKSTFFPGVDELKDHFQYAQKHRILLPVAWIHRFFRAIRYHFICLQKGYSPTDTLNKANYRIDLLNQLDMLEKRS